MPAGAVQLGDFDLDGTVQDADLVKELESVMAGSYLVYAPGKFEFVKSSDTVKLDADQAAALTTAKEGGVRVTSGSKLTKANSTAGYYIFRREVENAGASETYEYSGFYYDQTNDKYYRLQTATETGDADSITGTTLDKNRSYIATNTLTIDGTTKKVTAVATPIVTTRELNFTTESLSNNGKDGTKHSDAISAVLRNKADNTSFTSVDEILVTVNVGNDEDATNDLVFHLELAESLTPVADTDGRIWSSANWTAVVDPAYSTINWSDTSNYNGSQNLGYIYYNKELKSGDTSEQLVKSVTLDSKCQGGYADFTYDINVVLESLQITYDDANNEIIPSGAKVESTNKTSAANKPNGWAVKGTVTDTAAINGTISSIAWTAADSE